jgi:MFS family permease
VRLGAALTADRWRRQKEVAATGYALSAASRIGLLAVGGALNGIAGFVLVDRIGKGIRTAPRDALISLSVPPERLGLAFGVHRTLDTGGALIGPLLAWWLLSLAPTAFDIVLLPSFAIALIGLGVIVLLVENKRSTAAADQPASSLVENERSAAEADQPARLREKERSAAEADWPGSGLVKNEHSGAVADAVGFRVQDAARLVLAPRFRLLVVAAGLLALFTASDAFIYIGLQRRSSLALAYFPLLYVGTALFYLLLAVPAGRVADRIGRRQVFVVGQLVMLVALTLLLVPALDGSLVLVLVLPLLGSYYALTDGVLMAATSAELGERLRTSGLGLLTTVTSLGSLVSSVLLGALWTAWGMQTAFGVFAVLLGGVTAWSASRLLFVDQV